MLSDWAWGQVKTRAQAPAQAKAVNTCFTGAVEGDIVALILTGFTGSQRALISGRVYVLRNKTAMFRV